MKRLQILGMASVVLGWALPSLAQASNLDWFLPSTNLSGHVIEGSFNHNTSTGEIYWITIEETGLATHTYGYPGGTKDGIFHAQTTPTVSVGDPVFYIDVSALPTVVGNYAAPEVGIGTCFEVSEGLCTRVVATQMSNSVVLDGRAPSPIPTLTEWAMILLATTLAGVAALSLYRRRQDLTGIA